MFLASQYPTSIKLEICSEDVGLNFNKFGLINISASIIDTLWHYLEQK